MYTSFLRFRFFLLFVISAGLIYGAVSSSLLRAQEADVGVDGEPSALTLGSRFSESVQEFYLDDLLRVWEDEGQVLFLNLRGTFLESAEQEVNAGLVWRMLNGEETFILGANIFYDARWTRFDNQWDQLGLGLEFLTEMLDARFNYYIPESGTKTIRTFSETTVTRVGRRTTTTTTNFRVFEEALEGFDVEVGGPIPGVSDIVDTRLFLGWYDFNSDFGSDADGVKVRLEIRPIDLLYLDAEYIEDRFLNGTDYFVGFRVNLPFDMLAIFGGQNPFEGMMERTEYTEKTLSDRMDEMVIRDFRVRNLVQEAVVSQTVTVSEESSSSESSEEEPCEDFDCGICQILCNGEVDRVGATTENGFGCPDCCFIKCMPTMYNVTAR